MRSLAICFSMLALSVSIFVPNLKCRDDKKTAEAEALLAKARELSDIRCEGCPAFQLRAHIDVIEGDSTRYQGKYALFWAAPRLWREEIELPGLSQVRGMYERGRWQRGTAEYSPLRVHMIRELFKAPSGAKLMGVVKASKIWSEPEIVCAKMTWLAGSEIDYCFEKRSGVVVRQQEGGVESQFSDFVEFRTKVFPRKLTVSFAGRWLLAARVDELGSYESYGQSTFQAPLGASTDVPCFDSREFENPKAINEPSPQYPESARRRKLAGTVRAYAVLGKDGLFHALEIIESGGPDLDQAALRAWEQWRFRPGLCRGAATDVVFFPVWKFEVR